MDCIADTTSSRNMQAQRKRCLACDFEDECLTRATIDGVRSRGEAGDKILTPKKKLPQEIRDVITEYGK